MNFYTISAILIMHCAFDWWLQTRWQAENKSKSWEALSRHVMVYTVGLVIFAALFLSDFLDAVL